MALDFPANPSNGQAYGSYIYNSTIGAWQSKEDPATVAVTSPTAPASANNGDIWYNTNTGVSYVYYSDGTSSQWVEIVSSAVPALDSKADIAGDTFTGNVTAPRFISNITTGTAPLGVTSTTAVTNLNADLLDGQHGSYYAPVATPTFTTSATAPIFVSTIATGTAPLTVTSTTAVTNLNADLLDGQHGSVYSPAGMVSQFAGSTAPTGWLLCDGTEKAIATYAALYAVLGTTYGALTNGSGGAGTTYFRVPDLQGRVAVGPSGTTGRISTNNTLGLSSGVEAVTLTSAQSGVPAHSHPNTLSDPGHSHGLRGPVWRESGYNVTMRTDGGNGVSVDQGLGTGSSGTGITISNANNTATNASQSHTNLQPYIVLNYIIKT